jgi:hypothetical protein
MKIFITAVTLALITFLFGGCVTGEARPEWMQQSLLSNGRLDASEARWIEGVYKTRIDFLDAEVERPPHGVKTLYDWLTYGKSSRQPTYVVLSLRDSQNLEIAFFDEGEAVARCLLTKEDNRLALGPNVQFELERISPRGEGATRSAYTLRYHISPAEAGGLDFTIDIHEHHRSYLVFNHRRNMTWRFRIETAKEVTPPNFDSTKLIVPFMPRSDT